MDSISFILPTHDRPATLAATLTRLGRLRLNADDVEVVVVDNASTPSVIVPDSLACGAPVRLIRNAVNIGAAARNIAAKAVSGEWLVMLDDDSHPLDTGFLAAAADAPPEVAAIGGEILLPDGSHEAGGLPEVFVGCGVMIRRNAFLEAHGYDLTFHFYAEEYDLAAKLLAAGHRITHDGRFRVRHEKTESGRSFADIIARLVRNNGWVIQRYAPDEERERRLEEMLERYEMIARRESVSSGYARGLCELERTIDEQPRCPLEPDVFDRFTGRAHCRDGLGELSASRTTVAIVDEGKNVSVLREAILDLGLREVGEQQAETLIIGTLSPGPMLDAWVRRRGQETRPVVMPWTPFGRSSHATPPVTRSTG